MLSARSLCLALLPVLVHCQYQLAQEYSGSTFFDRWQFYDNFDNLTHGDAIFVSQEVGASAQLAFVNDAGNAIVKVDNTTTVAAGQKRNTVRIQTNDIYGVGSLWIADMTHVPYGCSVWPAWWSGAPNWPQSGEIDTFEGVNQVTTNQMALHTNPGCTLDLANASFTGTVNSTDCSFQNNNNEGCVIQNNNTNSYGAGFAAAGGGVFVTEFALKGISIWFFTRSEVPKSLTSNTSTVDTSKLGKPVANFPSVSCDSTFFQPQHLTLDITLCGDFAGNPLTFAQTCTGTCYDDYVVGPPSTYDNAYFEIKSIRAYHDPRFPVATVSADPSSTNTVAQKPGPTFHNAVGSNGVGKLTSRGLGSLLALLALVCAAMAS